VIIITYHPLGNAIPDGAIAAYVEEVKGDIALWKNGSQKPFCKNPVGSEGVILALRIAIAKGEIEHNDIAFFWNGLLIQTDENGTIYPWPTGFCSAHFDMALEMLHAQVNKE
jgi:hypothetical protein